MKTRIAPTPSGYLHVGNLLSFAYTWLLARQQHGSLLLRIDDIDNDRFRPAYLDFIFSCLRQYGISYTEGPQNADDFVARWSQQHRMPRYQQLLQQLAHAGHVFACQCSRRQQQLQGCPCQHLALRLDKAGVQWKLRVPKDSIVSWNDALLGHQQIPLAKVMGSFVVKRKNGWPSYQLASVADDEDFAITHIVRGHDLLHSTAAQLLLAQLLGFSRFQQIRFYHHALLTDKNGQKLSKSAGAQAAPPEPAADFDEQVRRFLAHHYPGLHWPAGLAWQQLSIPRSA
jgi:glutamyl-tRNA synthetase